jgi:hypothetical protein
VERAKLAKLPHYPTLLSGALNFFSGGFGREGLLLPQAAINFWLPANEFLSSPPAHRSSSGHHSQQNHNHHIVTTFSIDSFVLVSGNIRIYFTSPIH